MCTKVALRSALFQIRAEWEETCEEGCLDSKDIVKVGDGLIAYHLYDHLSKVGGCVALTEFGDICYINIHIIIYTRARWLLGRFGGVIVEMLLGMSVVRLIFYGRTFKGSMDVRC